MTTLTILQIFVFLDLNLIMLQKGGFLIDIRIILFQINAKILKGHPSLTIFLTLRTYLTFMSISHCTKVHDQAILEILGFENLMIFADLENFS